MMKSKQIYYYKDELNDEFSGAEITPRIIDENYTYIHRNPLWDFCSFLLQNVISMPIKLLYGKLKLKIKYVWKKKLKPYKKDSYFVYVNHTQVFADVFIPSLPMYPKRNHFIVNPENVSMKFLGNSIQLLGAIPIPNNKNGMKNFINAIETHIDKGHPITIYPEAHIWPFYTGIRNFKSVSFKYPVKLNTPVYSITNTYQTYGKKRNKIKIVSYIDGPFYPDEGLKIKEATEQLRNEVYDTMIARSKNSNIEYIKYIKKASE